MLAFTRGISAEFDEVMLRIGHVSEWNDEFAAINHIGSGWIAPEVVAMAVYCAVRYPDDYASAVRRAVNIPGDSDSVGCVTGGLLGAYLGMGAIPSAWIAHLENEAYIRDVAIRLAQKKRQLENP